MQKYISGTTCHLLTDSRVLYYLFNQRIGDSSTKIQRWVLKLIADYPHVELHFICTTENLADYLTRQGLPKGDIKKLCISHVKIDDFYDKLPKHDFTLSEWTQFCAENPQYLTVNDANVSFIAMKLDKGIENIKRLIDPIKILDERLHRKK
jgi:hypothetical protein